MQDLAFHPIALNHIQQATGEAWGPFRRHWIVAGPIKDK